MSSEENQKRPYGGLDRSVPQVWPMQGWAWRAGGAEMVSTNPLPHGEVLIPCNWHTALAATALRTHAEG